MSESGRVGYAKVAYCQRMRTEWTGFHPVPWDRRGHTEDELLQPVLHRELISGKWMEMVDEMG